MVFTEVCSYDSEVCKFVEYLIQQFIESSSIEASAGLLAEVNDKLDVIDSPILAIPFQSNV